VFVHLGVVKLQAGGPHTAQPKPSILSYDSLGSIMYLDQHTLCSQHSRDSSHPDGGFHGGWLLDVVSSTLCLYVEIIHIQTTDESQRFLYRQQAATLMYAWKRSMKLSDVTYCTPRLLEALRPKAPFFCYRCTGRRQENSLLKVTPNIFRSSTLPVLAEPDRTNNQRFW
jgi:hypothetical protein